MDFAASLSADLSAALEVDVVEDRPETGERHVCVRPVAAKKVESVDIDAVQGLPMSKKGDRDGRDVGG
jgi:uncharacterized ferredoxin-like protein